MSSMSYLSQFNGIISIGPFNSIKDSKSLLNGFAHMGFLNANKLFCNIFFSICFAWRIWLGSHIYQLLRAIVFGYQNICYKQTHRNKNDLLIWNDKLKKRITKSKWIIRISSKNNQSLYSKNEVYERVKNKDKKSK